MNKQKQHYKESLQSSIYEITAPKKNQQTEGKQTITKRVCAIFKLQDTAKKTKTKEEKK